LRLTIRWRKDIAHRHSRPAFSGLNLRVLRDLLFKQFRSGTDSPILPPFHPSNLPSFQSSTTQSPGLEAERVPSCFQTQKRRDPFPDPAFEWIEGAPGAHLRNDQSPINWLTTAPYLTIRPAKTIETIEISLIRILSDGPEVSLKGSPTVSPTTVALWSSDPLP